MTLLLHPGFHKTATSWLQSTVFAERRLFRSLLSHEEADALLVRPHDFDFDPELARAKIDELRSDPSPGVVDVISSEILSGTMFSGSRDSLRLADRLKGVVTEAKVLLTVRSQPSIMKSVYFQYLKRGGRLSIGEFIDYKPEPGYFWFERSVLEFDRVATAYADRFGRHNVIVLPQELLIRDKPAYLSHLFEFAGIEDHKSEAASDFGVERSVSPPASGIGLLKLANLFERRPLNPEAIHSLSALSGPLHRLAYRWQIGQEAAQSHLKEVISDRLANRYSESNARLQEFAPVDLAGLGYETASSSAQKP